jgi:hypothetical protein
MQVKIMPSQPTGSGGFCLTKGPIMVFKYFPLCYFKGTGRIVMAIPDFIALQADVMENQNRGIWNCHTV